MKEGDRALESQEKQLSIDCLKIAWATRGRMWVSSETGGQSMANTAKKWEFSPRARGPALHWNSRRYPGACRQRLMSADTFILSWWYSEQRACGVYLALTWRLTCFFANYGKLLYNNITLIQNSALFTITYHFSAFWLRSG